MNTPPVVRAKTLHVVPAKAGTQSLVFTPLDVTTLGSRVPGNDGST